MPKTCHLHAPCTSSCHAKSFLGDVNLSGKYSSCVLQSCLHSWHLWHLVFLCAPYWSNIFLSNFPVPFPFHLFVTCFFPPAAFFFPVPIPRIEAERWQSNWLGGLWYILSKNKRPLIANINLRVTTGFPEKWNLRNKRSNSIPMMHHYPYPDSAPDWLKICFIQSEPQPRSW